MSEMVPLVFSLLNKKIVIIGGGRIAFRKAKTLVKSGASITIISPNIIEEFNELPSVILVNKYFEKEDIRDAHLIIAATNDKEVNQYVKACTKEYQWFNDVSNQNNSSFHTPAIVRRGDLIVSISTSGKSPVLSRKIKDELESYFDQQYGEIVNTYGENRKKPGTE